jgi:CRP-like cAMP-binding protein
LTLAVIAAAIHQIEHCFLFGIFLFDNTLYNQGGTFLGLHLSAYGAQNGIMGHDGIVGTLLPFLNPILPSRIPLHFIYNTFVLIPMLLGFRQQVRVIYDEWLAKALPKLSEEQLVAATAQSENVRFAPSQIIFRQGDPADKFYIISKGQVEILRTDKKTGQEMQVALLGEGQYFGEIGVLGRTERTATVKAVTAVECLALNGEVLKSLLASSSEAYKDVDVVLRRRLANIGALQGLAIQDSVNADPDTILKTRMIRDRLKLLDGNDISRILGRSTNGAGMVPQQPVPSVQPVQPARQTAVATLPDDEETLLRPPESVSLSRGFRRGVLLVRTGPSAGSRYEITAPRIIVGRRSVGTPQMDVPVMQIDDARVSRQHLEIIAKPDGLYARDLGSANGSWLSGKQLSGEPVRLENGAEIRLGPDSTLSVQTN